MDEYVLGSQLSVRQPGSSRLPSSSLFHLHGKSVGAAAGMALAAFIRDGERRGALKTTPFSLSQPKFKKAAADGGPFKCFSLYWVS